MLMTKHGALRLKKSNSKIWKRFAKLLGAVSLSLLCFACKSAPAVYQVEPLDLLDSENAFFLAVPKSVDPSLIEQVIRDNVPNISDKNVNQIVERLDKLYVGLMSNKKTTTYQCAVSCNIPTSFVPNIFSKKNGFSHTEYKPALTKFDIYSNETITVSVPDSNLLLMGRNIPIMLDSYVEYKNNGYLENAALLDDEYHYDFLKGCRDEIRFFANKPQSFLTILTGVNLDLKLEWVDGSMKRDPKNEDQYIMDLCFNFKNSKFVKAGKAVLTLAFGLTDSSNEMDSPTVLRISGIKIKKNQIYKLLTF